MRYPFAPWWEALGSALEDARADLDRDSITTDASPCEIRAALERYDFAQPEAAESLIADIAALMRRWDLHSTSTRYFGLFVPDVHPVGVAADALVAGLNPQLAVWSHAPASNEIEKRTLAFFQGLLGHESDESKAHFTTGGLEANHTAIVAALTHHLPGFSSEGLAGRRAVFYISQEAHDSFLKIAHAVALGRSAVRRVPVDDRLRLDPAALRQMIADDRTAGLHPFAVVGTAGTTSAGVVDPLEEIAITAKQEGLWFHADAAWGGAALVSPRLSQCLAGIDRADSVTFDAHKWLSVPMGAGMFFCRHRQPIEEAFAVETAYMPDKWASEDNYVNSMQWSRRFIGLKVFMALAVLGRQGLRDVIERQADLGEYMRARLRANGWSIVNETPLPVVCFTRPGLDDDGTVRLVNEIVASGECWLSRVRLSGKGLSLRACITNHRSTESDVEALLESLEMRTAVRV